MGGSTAEGKEFFILKDPKTDTDKVKKSHAGLVYVRKTPNGYEAIDHLYKSDYNALCAQHPDELREVFLNGHFVNKSNLMDIRARLAKEVE